MAENGLPSIPDAWTWRLLCLADLSRKEQKKRRPNADVIRECRQLSDLIVAYREALEEVDTCLLAEGQYVRQSLDGDLEAQITREVASSETNAAKMRLESVRECLEQAWATSEVAKKVDRFPHPGGRKPGSEGALARVGEWIVAETGSTSLRDAADFLRSLVPDEPYELPDGTLFELGSIDAEEEGASLRDVRLRYYVGGNPYECKLGALRFHLGKFRSGRAARKL